MFFLKILIKLYFLKFLNKWHIFYSSITHKIDFLFLILSFFYFEIRSLFFSLLFYYPQFIKEIQFNLLQKHYTAVLLCFPLLAFFHNCFDSLRPLQKTPLIFFTTIIAMNDQTSELAREHVSLMWEQKKQNLKKRANLIIWNWKLVFHHLFFFPSSSSSISSPTNILKLKSSAWQFLLKYGFFVVATLQSMRRRLLQYHQQKTLTSGHS